MAGLRPASGADELFTAFRPGWRWREERRAGSKAHVANSARQSRRKEQIFKALGSFARVYAGGGRTFFPANSFEIHYCISVLHGKPGERRGLVVEHGGARRAVDVSVTAFD